MTFWYLVGLETCAKLLMDNGARHVDILCAEKSVYSIFS